MEGCLCCVQGVISDYQATMCDVSATLIDLAGGQQPEVRVGSTWLMHGATEVGMFSSDTVFPSPPQSRAQVAKPHLLPA